MAEPLRKRLQRFFGFKTEVSKDSYRPDIIPVDVKTGKNLDFSPRAKQIWDWFLRETNDTFETLKNRKERYTDIEYMIYNEPLASFAVDLYADEVAQVDDQFNLLQVKAENPKVEARIKQLFEQWGIDQEYIREVAYNLVAYGDSFDMLDIDEKKGVVSVTPISVHDVTDRLEFKMSEIKKIFDRKTKYNSQKVMSVQSFIRDMEKGREEYDFSKSYLSYLFGFVIGENSFVYPWQVNHYRLESRRSEFFPFGRSMLINLIGPYRQLKTSMNLMSLTRAMKFPKEIYEVQTSEEMTAVEKWQSVNEARTEFQNLGILNKSKDDFSVGDEVWIPEGLIKYSIESNDLRIEDIADIELLRENFIMGTKIPRGYLIVDANGGWGTSGQSLLQQSKPFGRAVYSVQSPILKGLSHVIRTHFLVTGEFEKEYTEFQLSLNFPVVEEASDRQRMKQDSLRLANDILDNIKNALGVRDAEIPPKLVKDLFAKFSFLDPELLDDIIKSVSNQKDSDGDNDRGDDFGNEDEEKPKKFHESLERVSEDILNSAYFDSIRKMNIKECVSNGRHFITSNSKYFSKEYSDTYNMYRYIEKYNEESKREKV